MAKKNSTLPEWVKKYVRPGTNVHPINGRYYLYECKSVYDPEKKRAKKITGKYLGRITKEGFIPSKKRKLEDAIKNKIEKPLKVKEYGLIAFINRHFRDMIELLQKHFPENYLKILAIAYSRFAYNAALKDVEFRYQQSYFDILLEAITINDKIASETLKEIGKERDKIEMYMKEFIEQSDNLIVDMTHLFSYSSKLGINRIGYNSEGKYEPQVNLLYLLSNKQKTPVYYKILPGNIREVKAMKNFIKETEIKEGIILMDKGFYSEENIKLLEESSIQYIIPLKRDNKLIEYEEFRQNVFEDSAICFEYNRRFIFGKKKSGKNFDMFIYLDKELKLKEETDYLQRVKTHPEEYNMEEYKIKRHQFGTLVLITNKRGLTEEEVYRMYKCRVEIEQMFDVQKNIMESDASYMQDNDKLEGWMFITHIIMQWYFAIRKMLEEKNLLRKYSVKEVIDILLDVKKVRINGLWYNAEVTKKTERLLKLLKVEL